MARPRQLAVGLALLLLLGCKHNLDSYIGGDSDTAGAGGVDAGGGAGGDRPSGGSGGEGDAGGGGDVGGGGFDADACGPCPDIPQMAAQLFDATACCRGGDCGVRFGNGDACLARDVPDQDSEECPGVMVAGTALDGCCRPDGRCGLNGEIASLGCVARENIKNPAGDVLSSISCTYECETDDDCKGIEGGYICSEGMTTLRRCVDDCVRDSECGGDAEVCAIGYNIVDNRVDAFCQPRVGDLGLGDSCSSASDCTHGVCLTQDSLCSQICAEGFDCRGDLSRCSEVTVLRPDGGNQTISVCQP